jgi:hypothetical protein
LVSGWQSIKTKKRDWAIFAFLGAAKLAQVSFVKIGLPASLLPKIC